MTPRVSLQITGNRGQRVNSTDSPTPGGTILSCISHNSSEVPSGIDPSCLTFPTPSFLLPGITSRINYVHPSKSLALALLLGITFRASPGVWHLFRVSVETPPVEIGRESNKMYIYIFLINLFTYFQLCWVFVAAHGLSLIATSGGYSSLQCVGFSLRWLLLLRSMGSRHAGFSSCGTRAQ